MLRNKNIKMRYLLLISILAFIIGVGIVILYLYQLISQPLFLVSLFITLLAFSSSTSAIFNRLIMKRINKKKKSAKYKVTTGKIELEDSEEIKTNYGKVYLRAISKTMYSLYIVDDVDLFFSDEASNLENKINTKKISRSIQFYVFDANLDAYLNKISVFNYQAKNFYIASFLYNEKEQSLKQADNVLPNQEFEEYVSKMKQMMYLIDYKK